MCTTLGKFRGSLKLIPWDEVTGAATERDSYTFIPTENNATRTCLFGLPPTWNCSCVRTVCNEATLASGGEKPWVTVAELWVVLEYFGIILVPHVIVLYDSLFGPWCDPGMAALEEATEKNSQWLRTWAISLVGEFSSWCKTTSFPVLYYCMSTLRWHCVFEGILISFDWGCLCTRWGRDRCLPSKEGGSMWGARWKWKGSQDLGMLVASCY